MFALGAMGAAAYGAAKALRRPTKLSAVDQRFDTTDVHDISEIGDTTDVREPVVITEEVVVITETGPYEVELELIPSGVSKRG